MSRDLALFDFDGTLTTKDTLLEFITHVHGKNKMYIGFILNSPWILLMKLGLIDNQVAKERILSYFLRGKTKAQLSTWGNEFCSQKLPQLLRKDAMEALKKHQKKNDEIFIVSASADIWIKPFANKEEVGLICSELEVVDDKFTGKLKGKNCNGHEKVNRINYVIDINKYANIYAYGDSSGDEQMLAMATFPFFKKFN
jgi:HAD superfamily hydrolase (TIGR01490 family)